MGHDEACLSDVIGAVYDASVDARVWPVALEKACAFVDGNSIHLVTQNRLTNAWSAHTSGMGGRLLRAYLDLSAGGHNAGDKTAWGWKVGQIYSAHELLVQADLRRFLGSRFFAEWVGPMGIQDSAHITLYKTNASLMRVGFAFGSGAPRPLVNDRIKTRLHLLLPHFQRAAAIGHLLEDYRVSAVQQSTALNRMTTAIFLVSDRGVLLFANRGAERLLTSGLLSCNHQGTLISADSTTNEALRSSLRAAVDGLAEFAEVKGIALRIRGHHATEYIGYVLPLNSTLRQGLCAAATASAALFVHRLEVNTRIAGDMLAVRYALTPRELRVLHAVPNHEGVRGIAQALKLSESTVRTHLRSLFSKTNMRRQAELVKLLASYSIPIEV